MWPSGVSPACPGMQRSLSTLAGSNTNSYHSCVNTGNCAASRVVLLPSLVQFYSEFMQLNIQQKTQGFPLCRLLGDLSLCRFVSPVLSPPFQIPYPQTLISVSQTQRGCLLCLDSPLALWSRNVSRKKVRAIIGIIYPPPPLGDDPVLPSFMVKNGFFMYFVQFCSFLWQEGNSNISYSFMARNRKVSFIF